MNQRRSAIGLALITAGLGALIVLAQASTVALVVAAVLFLVSGSWLFRNPRASQPAADAPVELTQGVGGGSEALNHAGS